MIFPSLYQSTRGDGTPFTRHSSTTSWPSDARRSCKLWWDKTVCVCNVKQTQSCGINCVEKDFTFVNTGAAITGRPFNPSGELWLKV